MENDLMVAREQNMETEQYRNDRLDERRRNNELKRAKAETLLKE